MFRRKQKNPEEYAPKQHEVLASQTLPLGGTALVAASSAPTVPDIFEMAEKNMAAEKERARFPAVFTERRFASIDDVRLVTTLANGDLLEQATDEVISALQHDDPRIDVVHAPDGASVWSALSDRLDEDFAGQDVVAMRSIQASLDGLVTDGIHDTHDIRDILRIGDIKIRPALNLAGFKPGQDKEADFRIHYRVEQYGSQTDFYRGHVVGDDIEGVDRIFPVVLIYNTALLKDPAGGYYGRGLPSPEDERSQLILKAYVLDTEVHL